jgi:hypothetical protein
VTVTEETPCFQQDVMEAPKLLLLEVPLKFANNGPYTLGSAITMPVLTTS